jgi:hypothetical protein
MEPRPPASSPFAHTDKAPIIEQRFTIHPSLKSADGMNLIKHTLVFGNGETYSATHYTTALKTGTGAAHLFTRCFPDMRPEKYEAPAEEKNISLGSYDPEKFMLVVSFSVCAKHCKFLSGEGRGFTVREINIGDYKLIVFWSFLTFNSVSDGYLLHTVTLPPEKVPREFFEHTVSGHGPSPAVAQFWYHRAYIRDTLIQKIRRDFGNANVPTPPELEAIIFYMRIPIVSSVEWLSAITESFIDHGLQKFDLMHIPSPMRKKDDRV